MQRHRPSRIEARGQKDKLFVARARRQGTKRDLGKIPVYFFNYGGEVKSEAGCACPKKPREKKPEGRDELRIDRRTEAGRWGGRHPC